MRKLVIITAMLVSQSAFAFHDFTGTYKCTGHDPYLNRDYHGTVTISQQNTVYKILMKYNTGEEYDATGGQYSDDLLSVVFQDKNNLKIVGLEQYRYDEKYNAMGGFWVYLGKDKIGTETCKKE